MAFARVTDVEGNLPLLEQIRHYAEGATKPWSRQR